MAHRGGKNPFPITASKTGKVNSIAPKIITDRNHVIYEDGRRLICGEGRRLGSRWRSASAQEPRVRLLTKKKKK